MFSRALFLAFGGLFVAASLHAAGLRSGPMIGAATFFETTIWVQTEGPAEVYARYWPVEDPDDVRRTDPVLTEKITAFAAHLAADDRLRDGTTYGYEIVIDGTVVHPRFRGEYRGGAAIPLTFRTPTNWRFREGGHQPLEFTLGFGSCAYTNDEETTTDRHGRPYGSGYSIFERIYEKAPDAFFWLGDNVYLREDDWASRTGTHRRWTEARALPESRALFATTANYYTWDDHDFGPNDIGGAFWNKALTTEAFKTFTANPSHGLPETPGVFTFVSWGDVNLYLLDNRTYRTAADVKGGERQMFGKAQIDWLIEMLAWAEGQSRSATSSYPVSFHLICSGNQALSPHSSDNWSNYPEEFAYFRQRLFEEGIDGVVFISGDVHFGEASKQEFTHPTEDGERSFTIYDLTTSSLTAGSWAGAPAERNPHRWDIFPEGTDRAGQHNFLLLRASGPMNDRQLAIEYYDREGQLLNQKAGAPPGTVTDASYLRARDYGRPY